MAAKYRILVDSGAGLTLDENVSYDIDASKSRDAKGNVQFSEFFITVRGNSKKSPAEAIIDDIKLRTDEVTEEFLPKRIQIQIDDGAGFVDKYDFQPGTSIEGTPVIESFRTVPETGTGESHWRYELGIYVKKPGNLEGNARKIRSSIELFTSVKGEIVEKVWRVLVEHRTSSQADSLARSFRPPSQDITQRRRVSPQDASAEYVWTWRARQKAKGRKIVSITEMIRVTGDGNDYVPDTQIRADGKQKKPLLHLAVGQETIIVIEGLTISLDKKVKPPAQHFTESADLRRAGAREVKGKVEVESIEDGTFRLRWMEVWIFVGAGAVPEPKHGNHLDVLIEIPPPDGKIGGAA